MYRLRDGVKKYSDCDFVCFTDEKLEGIWTYPFKLRYRNYWTCLEVFSSDIGNVLFVGLDTIFCGSFTNLFDYRGSLGMLRDPYNRDKSVNGVLRFPYRPDIWEKYSVNPEKWHNSYKNEMQYIAGFKHDFLCDKYPGQILSYKRHVLTGEDTSDARIVYFHGKPKPEDVDWNPLKPSS